MSSESARTSEADDRRSRVTIRQVAELAGVSIATVSRVLNGRADVSEETRQVVQQVARDHGYGPRRPQPEPARRTGLADDRRRPGPLRSPLGAGRSRGRHLVPAAGPSSWPKTPTRR